MQLLLALLLLVGAKARAEDVQPGSQPAVGQPVAPAVEQPVIAAAAAAEQPAHGQHAPEAHLVHAPQPVVHVAGAEPGSIAHKPISEQQVPPKHYAFGAAPVAQPLPAEQYGQPESASIPANYKPFGSWGLYIGGNPADGYYSNFYKSLGGTVDKQLGQVAPVAPAEQAGVAPKPAALGQQPLLRQSLGPVYVAPAGPEPLGHQAYPFEHSSYGANSYYTPAELSVGAARIVPPVAQGYGTPSASYEPSSSLLSYADAALYSTKRLQPQQQQHAIKELARDTQQAQQQVQQQQAKGYQQRYSYVYASPIVQASGAQLVASPQQAQVVAYPVPVGSQIVGSQPSIEGVDPQQAYGVHAFTRYAIKPTLVSSAHEQTYFSPVFTQVSHVAQVAPATYKQQQQQQHYHHQPLYQPLGFYGFPLGQLHYSAGLPTGQAAGEHQHQQHQHHQHAPALVGEQAASEKLETSSSPDKQQ